MHRGRHAATRSARPLPAQRFVFCCFNDNDMTVPATFDRWMAILRAMPGSVLFLYGEYPWAQAYLRQEAAAGGALGRP